VALPMDIPVVGQVIGFPGAGAWKDLAAFTRI
jgi:hypothetical protein